jgi:sugar lactone lactonase YvrE
MHPRSRRSFSEGLALVASALLCASPSLGDEAKTITVGPSPESVTRGFGGRLYVTLMGTSRTPGDGDGRIVSFDEKTATATVLAAGFDDPKRLVFTGTHLVTADFQTVWSVDEKGTRTVLAGPAAFPDEPLFLNDVALTLDRKAVLVTDMGARDKLFGPSGLWPLDSPEGRAVPALGRVYRIELSTGRVSIAIDRSAIMPCPNGVDILADGAIRVGDLFTGNLIEFRGAASKSRSADAPTLGEKDAKLLATGHRGADGVVHDETGALYLSEVFSGIVWRLGSGGEKRELARLTSAADHFVDASPAPEPRLIVPDTKAGTLVMIPLGGQTVR